MSKKSRRRNKKILAALALAGGAAMLGRRNRGAVSTAGQPIGVDRISTNNPPIGGTDHIPVAPKTVVADTTPAKVKSEGRTRLSVDGVTPGMVLNERRNTPGYGTAVAPPSILNPYSPPRAVKGRLTNRGNIKDYYSKGGRVKGAGKAKRGLGRAFTKAKK